jgi:hypothetical protein
LVEELSLAALARHSVFATFSDDREPCCGVRHDAYLTGFVSGYRFPCAM